MKRRPPPSTAAPRKGCAIEATIAAAMLTSEFVDPGYPSPVPPRPDSRAAGLFEAGRNLWRTDQQRGDDNLVLTDL